MYMKELNNYIKINILNSYLSPLTTEHKKNTMTYGAGNLGPDYRHCGTGKQIRLGYGCLKLLLPIV